jgi:hypothetical protein
MRTFQEQKSEGSQQAFNRWRRAGRVERPLANQGCAALQLGL